MQNSGPWDPWLLVVKNCRLFAQCRHSAGTAHGAPPLAFWRGLGSLESENKDALFSDCGVHYHYCCPAVHKAPIRLQLEYRQHKKQPLVRAFHLGVPNNEAQKEGAACAPRTLHH